MFRFNRRTGPPPKVRTCVVRLDMRGVSHVLMASAQRCDDAPRRQVVEQRLESRPPFADDNMLDTFWKEQHCGALEGTILVVRGGISR